MTVMTGQHNADPRGVPPTANTGDPGRRPRRARSRRWILGAVPIIAVLVYWLVWGATGGQNTNGLLPTVGDVGTAFQQLAVSGDLFSDAAASLRRVVIAVAIAGVVGVSLGALMGVSKIARDLFSPALELVRPVPIAAWVPLVIIVFGIGEVPAEVLVFLGTVYPFLLNTLSGVAQTAPIHLRAAAMLGAGRMTTILRVVLPSALPSILTALRLSLGIGWWVTVLAELLAVRSGLGYRLVIAQQDIDTATVVATIVVTAVIGAALNGLAVLLERRLLRWMH
jgi:ABC-type nitrate/sulfonate/bicarbonate transport system permease component